MTEAGLNTVNLSTLNTFQQLILLLLILAGSAMFVSGSVVVARSYMYHHAFGRMLKSHEPEKHDSESWATRTLPDFKTRHQAELSRQRISEIQMHDGSRHTISSIPTDCPPAKFSSCQTHTAVAHALSIPSHDRSVANDVLRCHSTPVDRRDAAELEVRTLRLVAVLVPCYFVIWQLLGAVSLGAWIAQHRASTTRANGVDPWWTGAFNAVSAFNNCGMSLLDANMV